MEMNIKLIEESTKEEVVRGYREDDRGFQCLLCGKYFIKGQIYEQDGNLYDAQKMVQIHIEQTHESVLSHLLKLSSSDVGISDLQLGLLSLFAADMSDKQISEHLGVASSTIRNHRYKLREKEKQAKIFLMIMELLEAKQGKSSKNIGVKTNKNKHLLDTNYTSTYNNTNKKMYIIQDDNTNEEVEKIAQEQIASTCEKQDGNLSIEQYKQDKNKQKIANEDNIIKEIDNKDAETKNKQDIDTILAMHVGEGGRLKSYPNTEKAQKIILQYVISNFIKGKKYKEEEVNVILISLYIEYKVLKKELIDNGLLGRSEKGGVYWVKGA